MSKAAGKSTAPIAVSTLANEPAVPSKALLHDPRGGWKSSNSDSNVDSCSAALARIIVRKSIGLGVNNIRNYRPSWMRRKMRNDLRPAGSHRQDIHSCRPLVLRSMVCCDGSGGRGNHCNGRRPLGIALTAALSPSLRNNRPSGNCSIFAISPADASILCGTGSDACPNLCPFS